MAFGIKRDELTEWKRKAQQGEIAFLTHYWLDERFPDCNTVTKVGCCDIQKLESWGMKYGLRPEWIHRDDTYPHFDLFGKFQRDILIQEGKTEQLRRFNLLK
ncbi:hypothetical protein EDD68_12728 [Melghiribacillus thermohalophilus]|uniref:YneQ n=1 Tax=Melghiribacillus thermohalophilus TaxID=1324956 RepID=A0A4R3MR28_9BACI|nr:hypothetical protein [Melghiribacillus thermohalophilus]TCT17610.1 hypothetical protein EDD68_12728 [Melghiribacillus thermohalophilus]